MTITKTTRKRGGKPMIPWENWDGKLGTMPDWKIAERIGVCPQAVHQRRTRMKIPAFRKHTR